MTALNETSGYEELMMYPAPLNFTLLPLIVLSPSATMVKRYAQYFKYVSFWTENIFFLIAFILYMVFLIPIIFVKKIYQILFKIRGILNKIIILLGWLFLGIFYLIYSTLQDILIFVTLLCIDYN
jgi:hypothetical protein